MRAWENRSDCVVTDEPLYAAFLKQTGLDHPGAAEVIADGDIRLASRSRNADRPDSGRQTAVVPETHEPSPAGRAWIMTGSMRLSNVFLIRAPERRGGFLHQIARRGHAGGYRPAAAGRTVRRTAAGDTARRRWSSIPASFSAIHAAYLQALCAHVGITFEQAHAAAGRRDRATATASGPSTGTPRCGTRPAFEARPERTPALSAAHQTIADACRPAYETLHAERLRL